MSNQTPINDRERQNTLDLQRGLRAPLHLQTYKNILYLILAFPLDLIYFVSLSIGVTLGFGMLILWIGLPILHVTLFAATLAAKTEASLARNLGGVNAPVPTYTSKFDMSDVLVIPGEGFLDALNRLIISQGTWASLSFVLEKFAFGLLAFIALTVSVTVTGAFLMVPFIYGDPGVVIGMGGMIFDDGYTVGTWIVDTFPEALVAAIFGIILLFCTLNLLNSLAQFHAHSTKRLHKWGGRR